MTVDDLRQSLTATKPPEELSLALAALWWDARAIGCELMNRHSRTKDPRAHGCTPTCTAKKAIKATQPTGMAGRVSR